MKVVADLHLHSKYSRAVSQQMTLPEMAKWAKRKGIDLLGTGDFTHPLWFRELKSQLEEVAPGLYSLKTAGPAARQPHADPTPLTSGGPPHGAPRLASPASILPATPRLSISDPPHSSPLFMLTTEISSIYSQGGRLRRIHNLIFAPNLETVEKINADLLRHGANLMSDGRPIIGLSARDLVELVLSVDQDCLFIPAHAWTPWFSLYGSESGFDSINECFGEMVKRIFAIETGLSSSPAMNWRIAELDSRAIISFSDAHSPAKLGREATVFASNKEGALNFSYKDIKSAIKGETGGLTISSTIEFYPEEGKYHFTGHRNCQIRQSPEETKRQGTTCPVCGKDLTVGVIHRVEQLAKLKVQSEKLKVDDFGVRWIYPEDQNRPPYVMLVPLLEIIAEAFDSLTTSQKVINEYNNLTDHFASEFQVLLETPIEKIGKISGERLAQGIAKVRKGEIVVEPGYDGEYGVVKIWPPDATQVLTDEKDQLSLF